MDFYRKKSREVHTGFVEMPRHVVLQRTAGCDGPTIELNARVGVASDRDALAAHDALCALVGRDDVVDKLRQLVALRESWLADVEAHTRMKRIIFAVLAFTGLGIMGYLMYNATSEDIVDAAGVLIALTPILIVVVGYGFMIYYKCRQADYVLTRWNSNTFLFPRVKRIFSPWSSLNTVSVLWKPQTKAQQEELFVKISDPDAITIAPGAVAVAVPAVPLVSIAGASPSASERLTELNGLLNAGLITQEIFEKKRESIVAGI